MKANKKRVMLLDIFREVTGKTVATVPNQNGPIPQYWGSKVERFWK